MEDGIETNTSIFLHKEREKEKIDMTNAIQEIKWLLDNSDPDEEYISIRLKKNIWRTILNLSR